MAKPFLLSICLLVSSIFSSIAQDTERLADSKELINQGIEAYDTEKYDEAHAFFDQVLPSDTNYLKSNIGIVEVSNPNLSSIPTKLENKVCSEYGRPN